MSDIDREECIYLVLWEGDPRLRDYLKLKLPENWLFHIGNERLCGEKLNRAFRTFPHQQFYGFLADDIQLMTPNMLSILRESAQSGFFCWPNDGIHGPRLSTHPVSPGNFIRALDFWAHPRFPHWGFDKILNRVANAIDIVHYFDSLHITVDRVHDETYSDAELLNAAAIDDMVEFERNDLSTLINRVRHNYKPFPNSI